MSQNLGDNAIINNLYSQDGWVDGYSSTTLIANESITLTGDAILDSYYIETFITLEAPKIYVNATISIRSDGGSNTTNKLIFNNSSVNFDNAEYDTDTDYIGPMSFTGNSSINITASSNNKTLIKVSTLTGNVDLDVDGSSIVESVSFSIQATTNSLIVNTPTGWTVTPSTSGDITTYTVARVQLPNVKELNINNTTYQIKDEYARRQLNNIAETKQDVIPDLDSIRSGASAGATAVQPSTLSNYVTINTSQTITNNKTFSAPVNFTGNMSIECNPSIKSGNYFAFPQLQSGLTIYRPAIEKNDSDNTFNLGNSVFNLRLLGLETRPKYNGNDLALKSDVPTQASDIGAVASNTAITGATKCKITYDSKGLVTAGADLSSSDITTALGYTPYNSTNPNGYTSNVGTVTSVNNTSPDGNGNVSISVGDTFPSQTGQSGKFLTTNGSSVSWASVDALPSQTGNSGKFLTTNGTTASWGIATKVTIKRFT